MRYRSAPRPLGGTLYETPSGGLVADDGRQVFGISTDAGEAFSGISGPSILYIVDEASGVAEEIYETIEGNRAGGASLLVIGNPTHTSGTFYRAFTVARAGWSTHHISSLEAAAWQHEHGAIPGLATAEWAAEMAADYGRESAVYQIRVLGDFAQDGSDVVIGLSVVQAAIARWVDEPPTKGRILVGVDVARYGDDESVIQIVRGAHAFAPIALRGLDGPQLAARVVLAVDQAKHAGDRYYTATKPRVNVDVIGVGASCYDALAREDSLDVVGVNVGESATADPVPGEPGFSRLRDQVWFAARAWLLAGGTLPADPKLEADLVAPRFGFALDGRYRVESKDDIKKRLGRSPDRGDALCLAVCDPPREVTTAELWANLRA